MLADKGRTNQTPHCSRQDRTQNNTVVNQQQQQQQQQQHHQQQQQQHNKLHFEML